MPLARFRPLDIFLTSVLRSVFDPFADGKMMVLLTTERFGVDNPSVCCRSLSGAVGSGDNDVLCATCGLSVTRVPSDIGERVWSEELTLPFCWSIFVAPEESSGEAWTVIDGACSGALVGCTCDLFKNSLSAA